VTVGKSEADFGLTLVGSRCVVGVSQGDEGVASSGKEGIAALLAQSRSVICRQGLSATVRRRGRGGWSDPTTS